MAINIVVNFSQRRGGETALSKTMNLNAGSTQDCDINMQSGSTFGNTAGTLGVDDTLQPRANLLALHYEATLGDHTVQHHLSGSYLSGGVSQSFFLGSGNALQWVQCSGLLNPIFNSGSVTAVSAVKGTTMSGVNSIVKLRHSYI